MKLILTLVLGLFPQLTMASIETNTCTELNERYHRLLAQPLKSLSLKASECLKNSAAQPSSENIYILVASAFYAKDSGEQLRAATGLDEYNCGSIELCTKYYELIKKHAELRKTELGPKMTRIIRDLRTNTLTRIENLKTIAEF